MRSVRWHARLVHQLRDTCNVVEWCRAPHAQDLVLAATYQLQDGQQHTGSLTLAREAGVCGEHELPYGVFDARWHACEPLLALAGTHGRVALWRGDTSKPECIAHAHDLVSRQDDNPAAAMATGLDWSSDASSIAVSYSDGHIAVLPVDPGICEASPSWDAHAGLEAWVVAWLAQDQHVLLSGGDDGTLRIWDTRTRASTQRGRTHDAGVTCIVAGPDARVLTGSYDQHVREWDLRAGTREPLCAFDTGGGVWRLRQCPHDDTLWAAACMQDGFKTLQRSEEGEWSVHAECRDTASLAYGIDWSLAAPGVLATASFYDKEMRIACVEEIEDDA